MMFCKLLWHDIKAGIIGRVRAFIVPAVLYGVAFFHYLLKLGTYQNGAGALTLGQSFGDALLFIFGGMKEYDPSLDRTFSFPALWMLLYLLLAYLLLYYPHRDLEESGQNILVRTGGRNLWWMAKCLWNLLSVCLYFLLGWGVVFLLSCITNTALTMQLSPNINVLFDMKGFMLLHPERLTFEILVMPVLVMTACCMLQMTVSLFVGPIFSYLLTITILLAGAYYVNPLMIGNYAMPVRSSRMISGGMLCERGVILCAVLIFISVMAGLIRFRKMDILNKGD